MSHRNTANLTRTLLFVLFTFFFSASRLSAQTTIGRQKVDQFYTGPWTTPFYGLTWLPGDYYSNSNSYPLIVFLHGTGEAGTGVSGLYNLLHHSLPLTIANGWDPKAVNPADGKTYQFIVVSPQAPAWSCNYDNLSYIIPDIMSKYRIDPARIYVTGVSAGGAGTWATVTNGATFAQKFAAVVPVSAAGTNTPYEAAQIPMVGGTYGDKVWNICGTGDAFWSSATNYTNQINTASPAPSVPAALTGLPGGHDASVWNVAYDPNWRSNEQNLNVYEWMLKFTRGTSTSTPSTSTPSAPTPTATSVSLTSITRIEAESFASQSGTQTEGCSDAGGTQDVGYIDNGDWMDYPVNVTTSGTYTVSFRVASQATGGQLQIKKSDGSVLGTVSVPNTGGWQTWQTVSAQVALSAGTQTLRIASSASSNWNFNWMEYTGVSVAPLPTQPAASTVALPGKVEAESFTNHSGTQTEGCSDAGGTQDVGYIDNGDWMDYSVNPSTSGSYTVNFRVATQSSGGQLQLRKSDGTTLATVSVPNTGGWQTWQTVSAVVNLSAGAQTLRVVSTASTNWNINWIDFASGGSTSTTPTAPSGSTTRIEAESFSNQSGTQTEGTSDAGGGQDVGYIDNGDWMDYSVNPSTSGSYTINFRVATQSSGGQFQLRKADGTVLATVAVPNTGGWQTWQTISANVTLAAGQQTLRIVSTASANWNINWLEMVSGGSTSSGSTTTTSSQRIEAEKFSNQSGTQTEGTSDAGGGQDVGYIDNGDWMDYSVNVPSSATYTVSFRVATQQSGGQLQLRKADGTVLATVSVPNTGGWQTWQTVSANVTLAGGTQTLRIVSTASPNWNINWFELASGSTAALSTGSTSETATLSTTASMSVYPNPVTDKFVLEVNNGLTGALKAQLYDMNGGLQKEFSLTKSTTGAVQFYLSIGTLPAGTYVLKASMSGWSDSTQVVKQ